MRLAARAWALREAARAALLAGHGTAALALARAAYGRSAPRARRLLALALVVGGGAAAARALTAKAAAG